MRLSHNVAAEVFRRLAFNYDSASFEETRILIQNLIRKMEDSGIHYLSSPNQNTQLAIDDFEKDMIVDYVRANGNIAAISRNRISLFVNGTGNIAFFQ